MPLKGTVWRVFPLLALIALGAFFHSTPGLAHFGVRKRDLWANVILSELPIFENLESPKSMEARRVRPLSRDSGDSRTAEIPAVKRTRLK